MLRSGPSHLAQLYGCHNLCWISPRIADLAATLTTLWVSYAAFALAADLTRIASSPTAAESNFRASWVVCGTCRICRYVNCAAGQDNSENATQLQKNALRAVPPEIGDLQELRVLDLTENELTWLPIEIDRLPRTTAIYVRELALASPSLTAASFRSTKIDWR